MALSEQSIPEAILSVENITLSFGAVRAIRDVSFDIKKGEIRAIIGPNGAGKTTLFYSILNLIKLNAGIVKIDDFEVKEEKWKKSTGVFLDDCFLIRVE